MACGEAQSQTETRQRRNASTEGVDQSQAGRESLTKQVVTDLPDKMFTAALSALISFCTVALQIFIVALLSFFVVPQATTAHIRAVSISGIATRWRCCCGPF